MKEHGIIFDAESMRANLDLRKTMTRRVIKPQPPPSWGGTSEIASLVARCPYGQAGDRLWAKETWQAVVYEDSGSWTDYGWEYDEGVFEYNGSLTADNLNSKFWIHYRTESGNECIRWRSPIYMPRWASRFVAVIESVRVERVQDISIDDAIAEGVHSNWPGGKGFRSEAIADYSERWDALNAKRGFGWDVNPWVWVIEYRAVKS